MLTRRGFLACVGAGALAAGCGRPGGSTLQRARRAQVIRVGISGEEPYSYLDASGQITGESPEVARAVLARLGVSRLDAVQRPFAELIPALRAGLFDLATAGMAITPDRCAQVAFSVPDFVAPTAFLLERGNPLRLRTFADVARAQVRIAVLAGAVEQRLARDAGLPDQRTISCRTQSDLWDAVFSGRARVGALTDISLRALVARHPRSPLEVTPANIGPSGGRPAYSVAGFAFRPEDADLRQAFDAGLLTLQASGEWLRVAGPFGVARANLPPPGVSTPRLCASS